MSYEDLHTVVDGTGEIAIDERDPHGRLRPVARGRLVGGDRQRNWLLIEGPDRKRTEVRLTDRHRIVHLQPGGQVRAA